MSVGAVAIGRNEGARLRACLTSLKGQADRIVYVDSGSDDGSVDFARALGVIVVELDRATPFTAARARNEGFEALAAGGLPEFVQFVDGDCRVEPGWIATARAALAHAEIGIVTGWRTEIDPHRNIYHEMAETEWRRPAGEIDSCGGDMMLRSADFRRAGGFSAKVICSEDEEFCLRIRAMGLKVLRLPQVMTHHDIHMDRFSQWWRRTLRSGHGFAEVGDLHPPHFRRERLRALVYGGLLPLCLITGILTGALWLSGFALLGWAANYARTFQGLRHHGMAPRLAARQALYLTLSKLPNIIGMARFYLRSLRKAPMRIIEYKRG